MKYSKDHEWITVASGIATIGISTHAQEQLGDVVESVKAASDIYVPVSGEVVEVNAELSGDPALVNRAPESDGWFMKVKMANEAELAELMDQAAYAKFVSA
jgi:glycine cleavage system H protein